MVLCGPHLQGAMGVNCARQLAVHNVQVTVFAPNFVKVIQELEDELKLFDLTGGKRTSNVKGNLLLKYVISLFTNSGFSIICTLRSFTPNKQ